MEEFVARLLTLRPDWTAWAAIATALAAGANVYLASLTKRSVETSEIQARYAKEQTEAAIKQLDIALKIAERETKKMREAQRVKLMVYITPKGSYNVINIRNRSLFPLVFKFIEFAYAEEGKWIRHNRMTSTIIESNIQSRLINPDEELIAGLILEYDFPKRKHLNRIMALIGFITLEDNPTQGWLQITLNDDWEMDLTYKVVMSQKPPLPPQL